MSTPIHPVVKKGLEFIIDTKEGITFLSARLKFHWGTRIERDSPPTVVERIKTNISERMSAGLYGFDNAVASYDRLPGTSIRIPERPCTKPADHDVGLLMQLLAEKSIWIAPVGTERIRGFMVCKRSINNVDGNGNTRIDYLRVKPDCRLTWKKPFKERGGLFLTFEGALRAACDVGGIAPNKEGAS